VKEAELSREHILNDEPEPLPSNYSQQLASLIKSMLSKEWELRPTAEEILQNELVVMAEANLLVYKLGEQGQPIYCSREEAEE
jgi:serine/threonine protein kinase